MTTATQQIGISYPFGATWTPRGTGFAVHVKNAIAVSVCLFRAEGDSAAEEVQLDSQRNRTGSVWHIHLEGLNDFVGYAYRVTNSKGERSSYLLDPYAKGVIARYLPPFDTYSPIGTLPKQDTFDWEGDIRPNIKIADLVIYEMHVGGFTQDPSSQVKHPGTYLGLIEKIPYLTSLGVNAIELLPVFEFNPRENEHGVTASKVIVGNYWGYSTANFFAPTPFFAANKSPGAAVNEFREMVKALHKAGIEVILDVVYNHTLEGNEKGPTLSFKGLDNAAYYILEPQGLYANYSGCGNTFNCNNPIARHLILESLRYWVVHMHVDGFRFDLASILTRDRRGHPQGYSPLLESIGEDPVLANVKLIAEPWDAGGLYQVGSFCPLGRRWSEWNGKYRDTMRRFIKGDAFTLGEFATRLCGSEDLYGDQGSPDNSINFITAHDGFTLVDLVSYNIKHNDDNGEGNRDGTNDNYSWNCGVEGVTTDPIVVARRQRQVRNFLIAMMVSRGVPMLLMGDEYGHTKQGNNNTWCLNDVRNWFQWSRLHEQEPLFRFFKGMLAFRKAYPVLRRNAFYTRHDIEWHGVKPNQAEWGQGAPLIAFTLRDHQSGDKIYVAFNATDKTREFTLPELSYGQRWGWVANTAEAPPKDFISNNSPPVDLPSVRLPEHSAVILKSIPA